MASLEDVLKKIEEERLRRLEEQQILEQQRYDELERQRQFMIREDEYYNKQYIYEKVAVSTSVASSASAGGTKITTTTTTIAPILFGESVLFDFIQDNIYKYVIHNFSTDFTSEIISFDLNTDWHIDTSLSVTNKGFINIFYDDDSIYRIFIIDLNGNIYYQKDITGYNYVFFNKYTTINYEENGKYYLLIYDGSVRTFEFDFYPDFSSNFGYYLDGGFVIETYDDGKFYLIKDGSSSAILIKEQEIDTNVGCMTYEYSSLITLFIVNNLNNLLSAEIYNNDGIKIYDYDFTNVSTTLNSIYDFSYLSESNSFTLISYDSDNYIYNIFYYSSESNSITYKQISSDYTLLFYNSNIRSYENYNNFNSESQFLIFTKDYIGSSNFMQYYDMVYMLPIFRDDESIRDFYEFNSGSTIGFSDEIIRRSADYINLFIDNGNLNYDILLFNKSSSETILPTDIPLGDIYNIYWLYNRLCIITYDNTNYTTNFITLDGIQSSGITFTGGTNMYYSRNTFFIRDYSASKNYYSNTSTGNVFIELENYYIDTQTSSGYESIDNLNEGNIVIYNQLTELAQIITDTSISEPFSMKLIQNSTITKYGVNVGKDYIDIAQMVNESGGIPYTHTQLSFNGPVDPLNYIMDGIVQSGDTYFGSGSSYFTNMYPGLFILVAEQINTTGFKIIGNVGADGGGFASGYQYSILGTYFTDYTIFVKRIYGAGDPSVNHIIIVNNDGNGITHEISTNTNEDNDLISGLSGTTNRVDYLLTAKSGGVMLTDEEISNIVIQYLDIIDGKNINDTLSSLNTNYANITSGITDSIYYFSDFSYNNGSIEDGGSDMYDGGNMIISLITTPDPTLIRIGYFDLNGELIDTISSNFYDLYPENIFGIRTYGSTLNNNGFYTFNGISINTVDLSPDDGYSSEINDWYWWND